MRAEQPVIFWTLIIVVALAPLPFASVYPWAWSLLACVVGALLAAWSLRVLIGVQKPLGTTPYETDVMPITVSHRELRVQRPGKPAPRRR